MTRTLKTTILVVIAALAGSVLVSGSAQAATSAEDIGAEFILSSTNSYRGANGSAHLMRDGSIDAVAQRWAQKKLPGLDLTHNPSYGSQMPQSGLGAWAENIAWACGFGGAKKNAAAMMAGWKESSGHRANMLNKAYTHIGIGFAYNSSTDCAFAVQNFGKYSGTFTDVPARHQFSTHIEWLVNRQITTGYADGKFRPSRSVSRKEAAAFLYRMAGSPSYKAPASSPFTDLKPGDQFYREINWLAAKGITTGYGDGAFRPNNRVSREQMAAFLYRSANSPSARAPSKAPFPDVPQDAKFAKEILWLSKSGITTGYSDGNFRPGGDVAREAMAAFLYRSR